MFKIRKFRGQTILLLIMIVVLLNDQLIGNVKGESKSTKVVTVKEYITMLLDTMKIDTKQEVSGEQNNTVQDNNLQNNNLVVVDPYIAKAINLQLLKSADEFVYNHKLTRVECAVLTNRADHILKGKEEEKKYENIINLKRIKDLDKVKNEYQDDVVAVFAKGIIIGKSNGEYTQDRTFKGSTKVTYTEAKDVINKLMNKKTRKKMSPDGQVIRTTKLPKNYKAYDYILEAFPNSFYEMKFDFQRGYKQVWDKKKDGWVTVKKVEMEDYARPCKIREWSKNKEKSIDLYLYDWCEMVRTNLEYRFNVDYRTIGDEWINGLRETYKITGEKDLDNVYLDSIKKYVANVKKNKIIIRASKIVVEPSTMYIGLHDYIRCYVKFKIINYNKNIDVSNIFFSSFCNITVKKNIWLERYFDIDMTPSYGSSNYLYEAQSTKISSNYLLEWEDGKVKK